MFVSRSQSTADDDDGERGPLTHRSHRSRGTDSKSASIIIILRLLDWPGVCIVMVVVVFVANDLSRRSNGLRNITRRSIKSCRRRRCRLHAQVHNCTYKRTCVFMSVCVRAHFTRPTNGTTIHVCAREYIASHQHIHTHVYILFFISQLCVRAFAASTIIMMIIVIIIVGAALRHTPHANDMQIICVAAACARGTKHMKCVITASSNEAGRVKASSSLCVFLMIAIASLAKCVNTLTLGNRLNPIWERSHLARNRRWTRKCTAERDF